MQKKKPIPQWNAKTLAICALLAAFSIIFGKYLAINLGESIRISFENLPLLVAGIFFGPAAGIAVGAVADLIGCLLVGYSINPVITLGAAMVGGIAGLVAKRLKSYKLFSLSLTVLSAHLIASVGIKTVGMWLYFQVPFWLTLGWRLITYAIISCAEILILLLLTRNRGFLSQVKK